MLGAGRILCLRHYNAVVALLVGIARLVTTLEINVSIATTALEASKKNLATLWHKRSRRGRGAWRINLAG